MSPRRSSRVDDAGVTLTELAVYIVLLGVIGAIVATVVVQAFRSEETVSELTSASSEGQNFSTLFRRDMANANSATVAPGGQEAILCTFASDAATTRVPVTWSLAGGQVSRAVGTAEGTVLIDRIAPGGSFTEVGASGIEYRVSIPSEAGGTHAVEGTSSLTIQEGGSTC
ncbi:MAG: hypothetical protein ACNYNX_07745 [Leucobacter sp.]